MTYVYLLGDYDEYGGENMVATLDRMKIHDLLKTFDYVDKHPTVHDKLLECLARSDEDLAKSQSGINLMDGWGGVQLYVVRLQ